MTTDKNMNPDEEYSFYAKPENRELHGTPVRRQPKSAPIPVRFPPDLLTAIRHAANADDRTLSAWLRRAAEHELDRESKRDARV